MSAQQRPGLEPGTTERFKQVMFSQMRANAQNAADKDNTKHACSRFVNVRNSCLERAATANQSEAH
eukprot:6201558-Pleurochrysis_carterae.AAC.3